MSLHSGATDTVIKSFAGDPNGSVNIEASEAGTAELLYDSVGGTLYAGDAADTGTNNNWTSVISGAGPTPLYTIPGTPEFWYTATDTSRFDNFFVEFMNDQSANTNNCTLTLGEVFIGVCGPNDSKGFVANPNGPFPSVANITPPSNSQDWTIVFTGSFENARGNGSYVSLLAEIAVSGGTIVLQIDMGTANEEMTITFDNDPANFGSPTTSNTILTDDNLHIFMIRSTANGAIDTLVEYFYDGTPVGSQTGGPTTAFTIDGIWYDCTGIGVIPDIAVYSSSLSNADLNTIGANLQAYHNTDPWNTIV